MQIVKAKEIKVDKITAFIYGIPGIGKTTLLSMLPGKTLIIDIDRGTNVLAGADNVDVVRVSEDIHELKEIYDYLSTGKAKYDNICLDSLSELERGMLAYYGRLGNNNGVPALDAYNRVDYRIVDWCRHFRELSGNIVYTAWEMQKEITASLTGEKYSQARPMLREKICENIMGLCDVVGRLTTSPKDNTRYIMLEGTPNVIAKDRLGKRKYCTYEEFFKQ